MCGPLCSELFASCRAALEIAGSIPARALLTYSWHNASVCFFSNVTLKLDPSVIAAKGSLIKR